MERGHIGVERLKKLQGILQGTSTSGKAYKIDNKWVAKSLMANIKIEGDKISADIPDWLDDKLSKEKPKEQKTYDKTKPYKQAKEWPKDETHPKDYKLVQIYSACKRCKRVGFISVETNICLCCVLDLANGNTEKERIASNKAIVEKLNTASEIEKAKWRKFYQEKAEE
jgi:hypothetical protein